MITFSANTHEACQDLPDSTNRSDNRVTGIFPGVTPSVAPVTYSRSAQVERAIFPLHEGFSDCEYLV